MKLSNETLIEQFKAQTLNEEQKKEFVKRLTTDRPFMRSLINDMELDIALDEFLSPEKE